MSVFRSSDSMFETQLGHITSVEIGHEIISRVILLLPLIQEGHSSVTVSVEVLPPLKPNGVMLNMVSIPNHTFTGQAFVCLC